MLEVLGITASAKMFIYLMLSFAFFVGILLMVSREAFDSFNSNLQKEYGLKNRFFPKIEGDQNNSLDLLILRYRYIAGVLISILAFILLLIYK